MKWKEYGFSSSLKKKTTKLVLFPLYQMLCLKNVNSLAVWSRIFVSKWENVLKLKYANIFFVNRVRWCCRQNCVWICCKCSQIYAPGLIVGVAQGESNHVNNQEFSTMTHMLSHMCSAEEQNTSTLYFSII